MPSSADLSFLTPYLDGRELMNIHLRSIRQFHPSAPILVSRRGGEREEMEEYRVTFGVRYWMEECNYLDALLRLMKRCETEFVCVLDHDTVLLSSLDRYVEGLRAHHYDLIGVEERIVEPPTADWQHQAPAFGGWLRLAPGHVDFSITLFNLREFIARWSLRGIVGVRPPDTKDYEYIYGVSQRLTRHKYLLPYHTQRYGLGNLLKDGDIAVAWHQWYGSHRSPLRLARGLYPEPDARIAFVEQGERAFLEDYPTLDLSCLMPAWGPDRDVVAEGRAIARRRPGLLRRAVRRIGDWRQLGVRELAVRARNRLERHRLLR